MWAALQTVRPDFPPCPAGEQILAWAPGVRKGLEPKLPGTLICTNLRVTFQPCGWQRSQVRW